MNYFRETDFTFSDILFGITIIYMPNERAMNIDLLMFSNNAILIQTCYFQAMFLIPTLLRQ